MKLRFKALVLGVLLLLAGCSNLTGPYVGVHIEGGQIGFEVDDEGRITIVISNVTFSNQAGAPEAFITGYRVDFVDRAGNAFPGQDSPLLNDAGIHVHVPAGIVCADETVVRCSSLTGGVPAEVSSETVQLATLVGDTVTSMLLEGVEPLRARITFSGTQGTAGSISVVSTVTVTNPFGGAE